MISTFKVTSNAILIIDKDNLLLKTICHLKTVCYFQHTYNLAH